MLIIFWQPQGGGLSCQEPAHQDNPGQRAHYTRAPCHRDLDGAARAPFAAHGATTHTRAYAALSMQQRPLPANNASWADDGGQPGAEPPAVTSWAAGVRVVCVSTCVYLHLFAFYLSWQASATFLVGRHAFRFFWLCAACTATHTLKPDAHLNVCLTQLRTTA
jgi:hypothetical protein